MWRCPDCGADVESDYDVCWKCGASRDALGRHRRAAREHAAEGDQPGPSRARRLDWPLEEIVFVGFNSRVAALDRNTGELIWDWTSPRGSGYVSVLLDGDRLIASVVGYTYCLNPQTGEELWHNDLKGMGTGVACLASVHGVQSTQGFSAVAQKKKEDDAARAAATGSS
jgi:hypothetical protein